MACHGIDTAGRSYTQLAARRWRSAASPRAAAAGCTHVYGIHSGALAVDRRKPVSKGKQKQGRTSCAMRSSRWRVRI
jgi:hypothetical protein